MSKIVYIDMDGVLVNLQAEIEFLAAKHLDSKWPWDIFKNPDPIDGAVEAFNYLCIFKLKYDSVYTIYELHGICLLLGNTYLY